MLDTFKAHPGCVNAQMLKMRILFRSLRDDGCNHDNRKAISCLPDAYLAWLHCIAIRRSSWLGRAGNEGCGEGAHLASPRRSRLILHALEVRA